MKTTMRRLAGLLCVLLCLSLLPVGVLADDTVTGTFGVFDYTLEGGKITITACSPDAEGKVEIPAAIDGHSVTALGDRAFVGCEKVTEVVIPKGIASIGEECFVGCPIAKITLPQTVESIGQEAFATKTLQSISVNKNNKKFSSNKGVLFNKKQTTLVCFPAGVTGTYTLPNTVKKIGERAFALSSLNEIKLSGKGKLATVGEGAFAGSALAAISLPKTVTSLGDNAFADCAALESAKLGAGVTALGDGTFNRCTALTSVSLPKTLTAIGERVFAECTALHELEIPDAVTSIGSRAFAGCTALKTVGLPDGVTEIPEGLFDGCAALSELRLPPRATSIGDEAFAGSGLVSVTIPASVAAIGERAFADCAKLAEIAFDHAASDELTIGKNAFAASGAAATTVRVPEPGDPGKAISSYDWKNGNRTVTWAQNEDFAVRTVKLTGAVNAFGGVEVLWEPLDLAQDYVVLRRAPDGETWDLVGVAASSPYLDNSAVSGQSYLYTVQGESDGAFSRYDPLGIPVDYIAAPMPSNVYNTTAGVVLRWNSVAGASNYRVFRKTNQSDWTQLTDTAATSYTDRSVVIGREYAYTVACISDDGKTILSSHDPQGWRIVYYPLPTPTGLSLTADNGGVHVSWNGVEGAPLYRVFRKTGNSGWVQLADTTAAKYYDTTAAIGNAYTYTVRCVTADGKTFLSDYDHNGVGLKRAGVPPLASVTNVENGVEVKWSAPAGAVKYRVFRKSGSDTGWHTLGETTATSFTDTGAKSGTKYTYTVRCITADGRFFAGDYDHNGKTITFIAAPSLKSLAGSGNGVEISWNGVKGAARYRVFRKGSSGWESIGETTGTSFVDHNVSAGKKYSYTVRCISSNGSSYTSGYDHTGKSITYAAAPALQSVTKVSNGVQIKWGKAAGAAKYRVFRKSGGSGWKTLGDTTSTSFVDQTAKSGTNYTYTVRCIGPDGGFTGGYNTSGLSITP